MCYKIEMYYFNIYMIIGSVKCYYIRFGSCGTGMLSLLTLINIMLLSKVDFT